MKKTACSFFTTFLVAMVCIGMHGVSVAGPIELKAVSYQPKISPQMATGLEWIGKVNEALKGEINVKYLGGPEVIPSGEQIQAVRNNVVQIGLIPIAIYKAFLEEANAFAASRYNPMEMRKSGFYDFLVERHKKIGLRYLGPFHYGKFYLWINKPAQQLADLKGRKMRSNVTYDRFMTALGMSFVSIQPSELYTALERGVVDGFGFPLLGAHELGWTQVTKYIIDHPFYLVDLVLLMNLSTWDKLPESTKSKIEELTKKWEPEMVAECTRMNEEGWKLLAKDGVKKVTFSPEEAQRYVSMAYQAKWEEIAAKVPQDLLPKLKQMTGN